jgi:hypothetical protein
MLQQGELDDRGLLRGDPFDARDVKAIGDCLIGILISLFKERGIYMATTTLDSRPWREHLAVNVKEELCQRVSASLVCYTACELRQLQEADLGAGEVRNFFSSATALSADKVPTYH